MNIEVGLGQTVNLKLPDGRVVSVPYNKLVDLARDPHLDEVPDHDHHLLTRRERVMVLRNRHISAIKSIRSRTGISLKKAKNMADAFRHEASFVKTKGLEQAMSMDDGYFK